MRDISFSSSFFRAAISACILFSFTKDMLADATYRISPRYYRSDSFGKKTPTHYVQPVSVPLQIKTSVRRNVQSCNSDACCDSNYFCQNSNFVCVSCSECSNNRNNIVSSCTDRCSLATSNNVRFPSLRWLSLSTSKVDAFRLRRNIDLRFAVQHDAFGLLSAQVTNKFC
jgi:hypothetical protein